MLLIPRIIKSSSSLTKVNSFIKLIELNKTLSKKKETLISAQSALEKEIKALKNKIKKTATDVGENFPTEARAMHYGEKEEKPIVGRTTLEEAKDLAEEGIPFAPLPWNDDKVN